MAPGVSGFSRKGKKGGNVRNLLRETSEKNFGDGRSEFGGIHGDCRFSLGMI